MNVQLCQQLKTNGTRCQSPAREHVDTCRLHEHLHGRRKSFGVSLSAGEALPADGCIELHAIEDSESIQRALSVVINAVAAGTLDPARAKVLLYGLQIASANVRRVASSPKAEENVRKVETAGDGRALPTPATDAVKLRALQPACLNECEQQEKKDENAEPLEQDNESVEAGTETPALPATDPEYPRYPGHVRIPPSCFSPASGYSSGTRDRLLAVKQRSESRSVV
jgi:hypothetical protein